MNLLKNLTSKLNNSNIDWILFFCTIPLLLSGLVTMSSFSNTESLFDRQIIWIILSLGIFFVVSALDLRFLRKTWVSVFMFISVCVLLSLLFAFGFVAKGALSWFDLGAFSFQPSDIAKLILLIVLAKYFSRRHVEIAHIKHIFISGFYAFALFLLVLVQPDFGSAVIIFMLWFGMVLISGISKKHLLGIAIILIMSFICLWVFVFKDYQKDRIRSFIDPLTDIHGAGYNAYQSTIAVGSGEILGKGLGFGTQSRLEFLPEYETDFVFAAFAEEWGFVGVIVVFSMYGIMVWRIILNTMKGATNFEILYGGGIAIFFIVHFGINVGMNIQLLPVTGTTLPFMSYGGSHLVTEFTALGILMAMRKYSNVAHKNDVNYEFIGPA